ncbi:N-acetylmuramoyl-L-alanine amidase [Flavobacterium sp. JP2137]|uniref:N-acetylmuramoyl-L-alanine amidase n=1 Tax=Flavobacterium sp. JP2137 TaxID=3414510 RepID=UPI003D2FF13E
MAQEMSFPSAGHHEKDPGAIGSGSTEFINMNLLRNKMTEILKTRGQKFETDLNHETNSIYQGRIKPVKGDVIMDLHQDAGPESATGITIIVSDKAGPDSLSMAKETLDGLVRITGLKSRGVIKASMTPRKTIGILNKAGTAILVELGFITNKNDMTVFYDKIDEIACFLCDMLYKYDKNK